MITARIMQVPLPAVRWLARESPAILMLTAQPYKSSACVTVRIGLLLRPLPLN